MIKSQKLRSVMIFMEVRTYFSATVHVGCFETEFILKVVRAVILCDRILSSVNEIRNLVCLELDD